MTRKVVTCSQSDTFGALMERMTTGKFRHLPVIEQDQLVGIVSIGDVVKPRLQRNGARVGRRCATISRRRESAIAASARGSLTTRRR